MADGRTRGPETGGAKRQRAFLGHCQCPRSGRAGPDPAGCGGPHGPADAGWCGRVGVGVGARRPHIRWICAMSTRASPTSATGGHHHRARTATPSARRSTSTGRRSTASPRRCTSRRWRIPERVVAAVRAIANADPGCVVFHCAAARTGPDCWPWCCSRWPGRPDRRDRRRSADLRPDEAAAWRNRCPDQLGQAVDALLAGITPSTHR